VGVAGLAAGMRPLVPDPGYANAGDYLEPEEADHESPPIFGLDAEVKSLELCCKAALEALPKVESVFEARQAAVSERTAEIKRTQMEKMTKLQTEGKEESRSDRKAYNRAFCSSRRKDFKDFVEDVAASLQKASDEGNVAEVHRQKKRLPGFGKKGAYGAPTHGDDGNRFQTVDSALKWWHSNMSDHWRESDAESFRPALTRLVRGVREKDVDLSDGRLDRVLRRMKLGKAAGDDDIPTEVYEAVTEARCDLYSIVRRVFTLGGEGGEDFPDLLVLVLFVMLYKGAKKGTVNEFAAYRPIGLMRTSFKLIDAVFVEELEKDTELFLDPAQEGSRPHRGARGNILRARLFIDLTIAMGLRGVMVLLDYSGAFDATSRKFLDNTVRAAGARGQLQRLYRSAMAAASGQVRVRRANGSIALSPPFDLGIGGIQGGMSTPWCFILAATEIMTEDSSRRYDLDFAIRRECLRMEIDERRGADLETQVTPAIVVDQGDWQYCETCGAAPPRFCVCEVDREDQSCLDEGEQRWNAAVQRGATALLAARAEARKLLDEWDQEVAALPMRAARWIKEDTADADGDEVQRGSGEEPAASGGSEQRADRAPTGGENCLPEETRPPDPSVRNKEKCLAPAPVMRDRPKRLHLVRVPDEAVDRCQCCAAAISTGIGFCVACMKLELHIPVEQHWDRLAREAAERAARRDDPADSGDDADSSDEEDPPPAAAGGRTLRTRQSVHRVEVTKHPSSRRRRRASAPQMSRLLEGDRMDYVDDTAVLEAEQSLQAAVKSASDRVSQIAKDSREKADQNMAPKKCHGLVLQPDSVVSETTAADVAALGLTDQCKCGEVFASTWGLRVHKRTCKAAQATYELDDDGHEGHDISAFLDVAGEPPGRFWRVKWAGTDEQGNDKWPDKGAGDGTVEFGWVAEKELSPECVELQNQFWRDHRGLDRRLLNGGDRGEWAGQHRCIWCNQFYKSAAALKRHVAKPTKKNRKFVCGLRPKLRRLKGTEVDRRVQKAKRKALLKTLPQVTLEGVLLSYKQEAEYLGHMFQGNGDCDFDVSRRTAIARTTFNRLGWLWRSKKVEDDTKLSLFESLVLSQVQWGSEGWLLTEAVQAKLNGWCSRCVAIMFDVPPQKEASPRTQRMCLPGIIQYRRMVWLGHLMREDAGSLTRRAVLRFAELTLRGVVSVEGSILMDAPAHNSVAQLVWMAGGSGTAEEREDNRAQWKRWALQKLCAGDLARKKKKKKETQSGTHPAHRALAPEQTAELVAGIVHSYRIYTDGGCDDQNGPDSTWGAAGFGVRVFKVTRPEGCADSGVAEPAADLHGPVEVDPASRFFLGATRGSNQTGELCGIAEALLYLQALPDSDSGGVLILSDSLYAMNQADGHWKLNCNKELILLVQRLLQSVRQRRVVQLVHVKGHSDDGGNDRADELVQWGKTSGPFSRIAVGGWAEGDGCIGPLVGHTKLLAKEEITGKIRRRLVLGELDSGTDSEPEELESLARALDFGGEDSGTGQAEETSLLADSTWRSSVAEMEESDDSHGSGTVLRLLLDGSVATEDAANESQDVDDMVDAYNELCIVGVETNESNSGLEANLNKL
jgi:ribonuclease HI